MYSHLIKLQKKLAKKVKITPFNKDINLIAGIDVSFSIKHSLCFCSIVILNKNLEIVEISNAHRKINLPYIPGLLSFRELPAIFLAYKKLKSHPDIFILDSQGIAHPRKLGLASHFGVVFNVPTIGCAKSKLVGKYKEPGHNKGDYTKLYHKNELVGYVLRSRTNVKPIFISPGHLVDFESVLKIVLSTTCKYRIPEPTRQAHISAEKYKNFVINKL
ncbi:deoxyribonuclease V [Deferribacter desulfuricans SSM1]|uniref:Endonuclease V n=1 Tax=Deferribacter desulfuricans (strain DSM 14783 / JCM 11476 / NBRC 101012 / SSM1) TaxID=639282 RepID=D3PCK8_DEFDS|nr:deoxyribonuclease V [Deferribacter desulfuricans]BAI80331.1 deoxyribonuclease V [Deferribacter desulfuricans SSM1]